MACTNDVNLLVYKNSTVRMYSQALIYLFRLFQSQNIIVQVFPFTNLLFRISCTYVKRFQDFTCVEDHSFLVLYSKQYIVFRNMKKKNEKHWMAENDKKFCLLIARILDREDMSSYDNLSSFYVCMYICSFIQEITK